MADDRGDELRALRQVIEACRTHAIDLDMPALDYILGKAESSLASGSDQEPPSISRRRARPDRAALTGVGRHRRQPAR